MLIGVVTVLIIAVALFIQGVWVAATGLSSSVQQLTSGRQGSSDIAVEFLEIVTLMLKAVFFYLIGIGLYSLFIAPLNLPVALGVQTLNDLETKVISVVVVILAVTFLEHYILWGDASQILQHGLALALVVAALVLFQWVTYLTKDVKEPRAEASQVDAQEQLFVEKNDRRVPHLANEMRGASRAHADHDGAAERT